MPRPIAVLTVAGVTGGLLAAGCALAYGALGHGAEVQRAIGIMAWAIVPSVLIAPGLARELRDVSPVFATEQLLGVVVNRLDVLMLAHYADMAAVGYYSAALRLIEVARLVPSSFMRAALPAMAETLAQEIRVCRRLLRTSARYMALYALAAIVGIWLSAPLLLRVLYGAGFESAEPRPEPVERLSRFSGSPRARNPEKRNAERGS